MNETVELVVDAGATCGESPVWDPEARVLLWTDTATRQVHSWDPVAGVARSRTTDHVVRSVGRAAGGGLVLLCADGIHLLDPGEDAAVARFLCDPERGRPGMMPNDGTVDPAGRFVFDTFNTLRLDDPSGSVYSVDEGGGVAMLDTGLALPNGIAFAPDGRTMYVAEMFARRILRYEYDPGAGRASGRRVFADLPAGAGMPDGLVVDAEGYVWSAHWAGWRITRYAPDGSVDRVVAMPFATATCPGFGGQDLEDLYLTTATLMLSTEDLARSVAPGGLFVLRKAGRGMAEGVFGGGR